MQGALSLHASPKQPSPLTSPLLNDSPASTNGRFSPALHPSGLRKVSSTASAASTKVIDGLQTELLNTKGHLERVKSEVRSGQRIVASVSLRRLDICHHAKLTCQMTRQNSDLVETKERLKSEIETLSGQLQRKERNLQGWSPSLSLDLPAELIIMHRHGRAREESRSRTRHTDRQSA